MSSANERGVSLILVAASLLFLMGAAAMAVDVSGFYQTARSEQRAADLACLAGVQELPGSPDTAFQVAASYLRPNHRQLASILPSSPSSITPASPPNVGEIRAWTVGDTYVEIETPVSYQGSYDTTVMRVTIAQSDPTTFGRVLGRESVNVTQEAYCGAFTTVQAAGSFPVGVPAGFGGGIIKFSESDCNDEAATTSGTGVCNYLDIPREDGLGGGTPLAYNMMLGADWPLGCHPTGPSCAAPLLANQICGPMDVPCNQLTSRSGNIANSVYAGLIGGDFSSDYLGRLAFSDGRIANPANPHEKPGGSWSSWSRPSSPTSWIEWNTNEVTTLNSASCNPGSSTDYFDPAFPGGPPNPASACDPGEVDDQPEYPVVDPPGVTYEGPPQYTISRFDCRDLRLVVVPEGTWGPSTPGPSNPRVFTITGFSLGYLVDPIVEDENDDGARDANTAGGDDNNMLMWNHQNDTGGFWNDVDHNSTNISQMSMLSVSFTSDVDVVGDCPLSPFPPALDGLIPKTVSLIEAP